MSEEYGTGYEDPAGHDTGYDEPTVHDSAIGDAIGQPIHDAGHYEPGHEDNPDTTYPAEEAPYAEAHAPADQYAAEGHEYPAQPASEAAPGYGHDSGDTQSTDTYGSDTTYAEEGAAPSDYRPAGS